MVKLKSVKKNFVMNSILTASSFIFPLITFPYISRVLGPQRTGLVSFSTSFISYFLLFSQLGIPTYGIRVCVEVRDDKEKLKKTVQELFTINLMCAFIAYIALFSSFLLIPKVSDNKLLFFVSSSVIILNCMGMEWLFKGLEEYTYIAIRSIVFKIIAVIFMFFTVRSSDDYIMYAVFTVFASSGYNIFNYIRIKKILRVPDFKLNDLNPRKHFKSILIFFAMSCAVTIYTNLDTVMLGFIAGDTEVGYYNASIKIKNMLISFIASLGVVLMPRVTYYLKNNKFSEFCSVSKKSIHFVMLVAFPCVVFFFIFAQEVIIILSGNSYMPAVPVMKVLVPTVAFIGLSNITGIQMLVPLEKEKAVLISEILGGIVDFGLNLVLIPRFGSLGAAESTLLAEFIVLLVQSYYLKEILKKVFSLKSFAQISICSLIAIIPCCFLSGLITSHFIKVIVGGVLYFGIYAIMLLIVKDCLVKECLENIFRKIGIKQ